MIARPPLAAVALAVCVAWSACRDATAGIRTEFVGAYAFTAIERRTIARVAGAAVRDARRHLPALPAQILLQVRSGTDVIPELGTAAAIAGSAFIRWTVDPGNPRGVVGIAETHLRGALFHEFHHLVRQTAMPRETLMDHVVSEGLATAFERDFAGAAPPWAQYPDDAARWVEELLAQGPTARPSEWVFQHPDGRRWIGMRAGTYLVDRAMRALSRNAAELAATPTAEILIAAGVTPAP